MAAVAGFDMQESLVKSGHSDILANLSSSAPADAADTSRATKASRAASYDTTDERARQTRDKGDRLKRHLSMSWCAGDGSANGNSPCTQSMPAERLSVFNSSVDEDYMKFRQQYRNFRDTEGISSQNENESSPKEDPYRFEFWYPTPGIFRWRFTNSYWTAITFILGSLLFTFNAAVGVRSPPWSEQSISTFESWPNFIGGCFFVLGCHASYLQLINVPTDDSDVAVLLWPNWKEVRKVVDAVSITGTLSYYIGAVLFQFGCLLPILPITKESAGMSLKDWNSLKHVVVGIPNVLGSALFVTGSVCELIHNRCFRAGGATFRDVVWWVANLDFWGSVLFLVGSIPGMCMRNWEGFPGGERGFELVVDGSFLVGSAMFIISSLLLVVMWQSNDFGLTLLTQLNKAIQAGAHVAVVPPTALPDGASSPSASPAAGGVALQLQVAPHAAKQVEDLQAAPKEKKRKFSFRGIFFIIVYLWFTFVAIVDVMCQQLWFEFAYKEHILREVAEVGLQILLCIGIFIVLALQSAVPSVPREQPYRAAVLACRILGVIGATLQTLTFIDFCSNPFDKPPTTQAPDLILCDQTLMI